MSFECDCQTIQCNILSGVKTDWGDVLKQFENVRKHCPALREILIPEDRWPIYCKKALEPINKAGHQHVLLGAFKHGNLRRITLPVHTYLLDGEKPKALKPNYKKDLIESWMMGTTPLDRHKRVKGFNGKLAELISALWLQDQGWKIKNLEALGGAYDIEAISPTGNNTAIEVKYIGEEDSKFLKDLESMQSHKAVSGRLNHYDGYNYILFRTYEAAKQLKNFSEDRYIFIVISTSTWDFVDIAVNDKWIQHALHFFEFSKWKGSVSESFARQISKYPNIEQEINGVLNQVQTLWVIKEKSWKYNLAQVVQY